MTITEARQQTRLLVQAAAQVCEDKKGEETRILELDPVDSGLSDFFLITSASNDRQATAIADEIEHKLKKEFGVFPNSVEGRRQGEWVLLDYVDFVVHVFLTERRAFYDIERLRKSARPLTPAEFDAELKAELAAKTLAARAKTPAKKAAAKKAVVTKVAVKSKPAAKKPAAPKKAVKKATAVKPKTKTVAKKAVTSKSPAVKTATKKTVAKKAPAKKAAPIKAAAKKTSAKKTAKKKSAK
jgi:ribosome-associated protein